MTTEIDTIIQENILQRTSKISGYRNNNKNSKLTTFFKSYLIEKIGKLNLDCMNIKLELQNLYQNVQDFKELSNHGNVYDYLTIKKYSCWCYCLQIFRLPCQ